MPGRLHDKVAVVTGASMGLGEAIARAFAAEGAAVVLTARTRDTGEAVSAQIRAAGGRALFVPQDTTREDDWARAVGETERAFGRLDILVNNAGIAILKPMDVLTLDEFRTVNRVNLHGVFLGVKAGVAAMRRHGAGGAIGNMSSIVGLAGFATTTAYAAAKGGVRLLTKAAALELGPEGIRVNSLHPGLIVTRMVDEQLGSSAEARAALAEPYLLKRLGRPDEVAEAAIFLASAESRFMTGAELRIDGGYTTA